MDAIILSDTAYPAIEQLTDTIGSVLERRYRVTLVRAEEYQSITKRPDLLVVGSATRRRRPTAPILAALRNLPSGFLDHLACTAFSTRDRNIRFLGGSAGLGIARRLSRSGALVELRPETFLVKTQGGPLVDGEVERATRWAEQVLYMVSPNPRPRY